MRGINASIIFLNIAEKILLVEKGAILFHTIYILFNSAITITVRSQSRFAIKYNSILTFYPASVILLLSSDAHLFLMLFAIENILML
jgi:hypothetical protein